MKLHILSDLHLEFAPHQVDRHAIQSADVVVLAGDIFTGTQGIAWARQSFPSQHIVYVAGNHEFYGHYWDQLLDQLRDEARIHCVDFLENESVTIDGIRFLGATLWTDFDYFGRGKRHASMFPLNGMNDRLQGQTIAAVAGMALAGWDASGPHAAFERGGSRNLGIGRFGVHVLKSCLIQTSV
jgi:predicted MPP superfamily phosphohydrolase